MTNEGEDEYQSLDDLMVLIRKFVQARDWESFQKPAALAVSASIELGELLELFQWLTEEEIAEYLKDDQYRESLAGELADVMIYMIRLADVTGINPSQAILDKLAKNSSKYLVGEWRGRIPSKTTEFQ
ncbi:MAG: nucleotide pyrophosphohydrolase [Candidatus Hermodarchaeota archaeon]